MHRSSETLLKCNVAAALHRDLRIVNFILREHAMAAICACRVYTSCRILYLQILAFIEGRELAPERQFEPLHTGYNRCMILAPSANH